MNVRDLRENNLGETLTMMKMPLSLRKSGSCLLVTFLMTSTSMASEECGVAGTITGKIADKQVNLPTRKFADGSIAVRAPLAVNPDGGSGSYTVGDHGFTYIANGLAAWRNGSRAKCDAQCMLEFKKAEQTGFTQSGEEFCVFAMEVEPLSPGKALSSCTNGMIAGNGKGRIKFGRQRQSISGATIQTYASTTSLRHVTQGETTYLDSESLPILVTSDPSLLRKLVWVSGKGLHGTFAIIGDVGPAFGEGSIALHQLLRRDKVTTQTLGPIPVKQRCQQAELGLQPPFQSKPDAKDDACKQGRTPTSMSDIRAYSGIDQPLDFVILGKADFPRSDNGVLEEVTQTAIDTVARNAGYTDEKIGQMLGCLGR